MLVTLNTGLRKSAFAAACLLAITTYVAVVVNHYLAFRLANRVDVQSLERAAALEPANADLRWKLGRYLLYVAQEPAAASANFETAVALNPHVAQYWLDLASSYYVVGDSQHQSRALEKALEAEPNAADVAWRLANFYLVQSDVTKALPLFRTVIESEPDKVNAALQLCWQATKSVDAILDYALPPESSAYFAFINLLIKSDEAEPAATVWTRWASLNQNIPGSDAFPYLDYLLKRHATESAVKVWQTLANPSGKLSSYVEPGNLIVNGNLENNFLNGGFDWRYRLLDAVQLSVDTSEFHSASQSLRLVFKGPALGDAGFFQYVPVDANTDYRFSVYTKAEDIESASGPRIIILDAYSGRAYVTTDDSLGTTGWRQQLADFRTGPETSMLMVEVARVPGDPLIKGTFWIDDVSLKMR